MFEMESVVWAEDIMCGWDMPSDWNGWVSWNEVRQTEGAVLMCRCTCSKPGVWE